VSRKADPLKREPRRSAWTPERMGRRLADHGFVVRHDDDLLALAHRLGLIGQARRSLGSGRVALADRQER
jgi:hypothetical protein